ncbi:MAG: ABC transporter substrate-binding protein [Oscillospiraceae bacterium]
MKTGYKIISLLIVSFMFLTVFSGCKKKDETDENKPVKLTWYQWGNTPKDPKPVIEALNKKSAEDIGVTIDFKFTGNGSDEALKMTMATGEPFDIAYTCSWYANYAIAASSNQLYDITEKVKTVTPKLYSYIPQDVWHGSMVNGKIYAVPTYKDSAAAQYWCIDSSLDIPGLKDMLDKTTAKSSSVTPILKAIKDSGKMPSNASAPFMLTTSGMNGLATMFDMINRDIMIGVKLDDPSCKVKWGYEDPDFVDELKTLHEWFKAGYINKDAPQVESEYKYSPFFTAQGFPGSDEMWAIQRNHSVQMHKKTGPYYTTDSIQGSMNGIGKNSKNVDTALKYLEYINTNKDYRNMLAYGIKDQNYKITSEDTVERLNDGWMAETFAQASFFEMIPAAPAKSNQWDLVKKEMEKAEASPLLGFSPDISSVKNEVASCIAIVKKYSAGLTTGAEDPVVKIPQMKKELDSAGLSKIIEAFQTQVDSFLKQQ